MQLVLCGSEKASLLHACMKHKQLSCCTVPEQGTVGVCGELNLGGPFGFLLFVIAWRVTVVAL
jgi:hypothetical protein